MKKQRSWRARLNRSRADPGQSSLCHLPGSISGTRLAFLGFWFPTCAVDRLLPNWRVEGLLNRTVTGNALCIQEGRFSRRGDTQPPKKDPSAEEQSWLSLS